MAQRAKRIAEENSHHDCDFRDMLSRVGDKWSLLVIFILKGRPAFRGRFSDLKRSIPGISQRMLTATVRNLERDGMLTRHVYAEVPPRVEYELTPLGRGLTEPVLGLVSWLQSNWPVIRSARDRFDARKNATRTRPARCLCNNPPLTTAPSCEDSYGQADYRIQWCGTYRKPGRGDEQLAWTRDSGRARWRTWTSLRVVR